MSAHGRAQVLYYAAENLELRKQEFAQTIFEMTGENGNNEVETALETIFYFENVLRKVFFKAAEGGGKIRFYSVFIEKSQFWEGVRAKGGKGKGG